MITLRWKLLVGVTLVAINASGSDPLTNERLLPASSSAVGGGEYGGGGDMCEARIQDISNDLALWLRKGGAQNLIFPSNVSLSDYVSKMQAALVKGHISCVSETLFVGAAEKTCINSKDTEGGYWITCNSVRFQSTMEEDQYILVHHEYAGLAGIEMSDGDTSNYVISRQITGILRDMLMAKKNIGIGTKSPMANLEIDDSSVNGTQFHTVKDSGTSGSWVQSVYRTSAWGPQFIGAHARGSLSSPASLGAGDHLADFDGFGYNGSGFVQKVNIYLETDEAWTTTANGTRIRFMTTQNGTTATAERMRIDNDGKVGIGTSAPDNLLTVNGSAAKPGGGSWGTFSDGRLKDVERPFEYGLNEVLSLHPVFYHYKSGNTMGLASDKSYSGFVAQDVQKIIPEAVEANDRGFLKLNQDAILWAMLNSIKEIYRHELEDSRAKDQRMDQLEWENAQLKARLEEIEKAIRPNGRPH
jgi:hypothetical protein